MASASGATKRIQPILKATGAETLDIAMSATGPASSKLKFALVCPFNASTGFRVGGITVPRTICLHPFYN